jgi:hypothetical protein
MTAPPSSDCRRVNDLQVGERGWVHCSALIRAPDGSVRIQRFAQVYTHERLAARLRLPTWTPGVAITITAEGVEARIALNHPWNDACCWDDAVFDTTPVSHVVRRGHGRGWSGNSSGSRS